MSEYKRLTKYECGDLIINCKACEYNEEHNIICTDYHCIDALKTRLAELEDKIENGTLVSIPFIRKHPKVENAYMVVYETEHGDLQGIMFCGENAKAEAEAKLKELKENV